MIAVCTEGLLKNSQNSRILLEVELLNESRMAIEARQSADRESPENVVAAKFYDTANQYFEENPENTTVASLIQEAGVEVANGNVNKAQGMLELENTWNDDLRDLAVQTNQLEQGVSGRKPLSFRQAQEKISKFSEELMEVYQETHDQSDFEGSQDVTGIVRELQVNPARGGIDTGLEYIEGVLQTKVRLLANGSQSGREAVLRIKELRDIRDALFLEKQRLTRTMQAPESRETAREEKTHVDSQSIIQSLNSPELEKAAQDPRSLYSVEKGVVTIRDAFRQLYSSETMTSRLQTILSSYNNFRSEAERRRPNLDRQAHEAFAQKSVLEQLTKEEQQAIHASLNKNEQKLGFRGFAVGTDLAFGDFLRYIDQKVGR